MTERLLRLPRERGPGALAALVILAGVAAFHFFVITPMEKRNAVLAERLARTASRTQAAQPASAVEKVSAVYDFLRKEEQTTDWLAKLHGIGTATGVQLKSASYRTHKTEGRILRYEIILPVAGSYPRIRDFLQRAAAEIPVMSIDQLTLKRESRTDGVLQAELRITLHMVQS